MAKYSYTGDVVVWYVPVAVYEGYTDAQRIATRYERRLYMTFVRHVQWKIGNIFGRIAMKTGGEGTG